MGQYWSKAKMISRCGGRNITCDGRTTRGGDIGETSKKWWFWWYIPHTSGSYGSTTTFCWGIFCCLESHEKMIRSTSEIFLIKTAKLLSVCKQRQLDNLPLITPRLGRTHKFESFIVFSYILRLLCRKVSKTKSIIFWQQILVGHQTPTCPLGMYHLKLPLF